ncbi:hypothetical protein MPK7_05 [Pseudomonas phage MPK7]|uniref:Uncharacterized protein n=1 Tax=Pseudomonas phage MPK7 TaxID=1225790 RepID=S4SYQ3_9CAUD|nr:hypothetical protein MPK7_05 [Pseudomonas phage MPK7]AFR52544.1 hypothetical protein MPK7_05 [Pseudomonas phage MPK7]
MENHDELQATSATPNRPGSVQPPGSVPVRRAGRPGEGGVTMDFWISLPFLEFGLNLGEDELRMLWFSGLTVLFIHLLKR